MPEFNREKFNTDPKHEAERSQFDAMLEDSMKRLKEKQDKLNPKPKEKGVLDEFFDGLFGTKSGGE